MVIIDQKKIEEKRNQKFQEMLGKNYEVISSKREKKQAIIKFKHLECGKITWKASQHIIANKKNDYEFCMHCKPESKKKLSIEQLQEKKGTEKTLLLKELEKSNVLAKCVKCGHEWVGSKINIIYNDSNCPLCYGNEKKTKENFQKEIDLLANSEYELLSEYKTNKNHVILLHKTCGKEYRVRPDMFIRGNRCKHCGKVKNVSLVEKEFSDFIKKNYKKEIKTSERKLIKPYELDIYIPDLKLAFEFNGLFWHSEKHKANDLHLKKTELCEAKGIQMIHIFEHEWEQKQEIVKSKVLNLLGLTPTKVFARSCKIQKLETKQKNEFLEVNHIQGTCVSSINYGLFKDEELVAVMTFSKLRNGMSSKSETATHELIRFATKLNTTVTGGFSKLLKNICLLHPEIKEIKTFASRTWSKGKVYERNGFVFSHNSKPNYFYFYNNDKTVHSRMLFQKHKLKEKLKNFDPKLTEYENMNNNKYYRIFDSGNKIYFLKTKRVCPPQA